MSSKKVVLFFSLALLILAPAVLGQPDFLISTSYSNMAACSCQTLESRISITNTGFLPDKYRIEASGAAEAWAATAPGYITLNSGETKDIFHFITIPCDVEGNYALNTYASNLAGEEQVISQSINVGRCDSFDVAVKNHEAAGCPCTPIDFELMITNTGGFSDTYQIIVDKLEKYTILSQSSIRLGPGEKASVFLYSKTPCSLYGVQPFSVRVKAVKNNQVKSIPLQLNIGSCYDYDFEPGTYEKKNNTTYFRKTSGRYEYCAGSQLKIPIRLANKADFLNNYLIRYKGPSWITLPYKAVSMKQGHEGYIELDASIPKKEFGTWKALISSESEKGDKIIRIPLSITSLNCYDTLIAPNTDEIRIDHQERLIPILLVNKGEKKATVSLHSNIPWIIAEPNTVSISPKTKGTVKLRTRPSPEVREGDYTLKIVGTLKENKVSYSKAITIRLRDAGGSPALKLADFLRDNLWWLLLILITLIILIIYVLPKLINTLKRKSEMTSQDEGKKKKEEEKKEEDKKRKEDRKEEGEEKQAEKKEIKETKERKKRVGKKQRPILLKILISLIILLLFALLAFIIQRYGPVKEAPEQLLEQGTNMTSVTSGNAAAGQQGQEAAIQAVSSFIRQNYKYVLIGMLILIILLILIAAFRRIKKNLPGRKKDSAKKEKKEKDRKEKQRKEKDREKKQREKKDREDKEKEKKKESEIKKAAGAKEHKESLFGHALKEKLSERPWHRVYRMILFLILILVIIAGSAAYLYTSFSGKGASSAANAAKDFLSLYLYHIILAVLILVIIILLLMIIRRRRKRSAKGKKRREYDAEKKPDYEEKRKRQDEERYKRNETGSDEEQEKQAEKKERAAISSAASEDASIRKVRVSWFLIALLILSLALLMLVYPFNIIDNELPFYIKGYDAMIKPYLIYIFIGVWALTCILLIMTLAGVLRSCRRASVRRAKEASAYSSTYPDTSSKTGQDKQEKRGEESAEERDGCSKGTGKGILASISRLILSALIITALGYAAYLSVKFIIIPYWQHILIISLALVIIGMLLSILKRIKRKREYEIHWNDISARNEGKLYIDSRRTGISEVIITPKEKISHSTLKVKILRKKPVLLRASGLVYEYFVLKKDNLPNSHVKQALIRFKVRKSWIKKHWLEANDISLKHYKNNQWKKEQAVLISNDEKYCYYESSVSGFSFFAICGDKKDKKKKPYPTIRTTPIRAFIWALLAIAVLAIIISGYYQLNIQKEPVQQPPLISRNFTTQIWEQGEVHKIDLSSHFKDPDSDTLKYTSSEPKMVKIEIIGSTAYLTPAKGWTGEDYAVFNADDGKGGIVSTPAIRLKVTEPAGKASSFFLFANLAGWFRWFSKNLADYYLYVAAAIIVLAIILLVIRYRKQVMEFFLEEEDEDVKRIEKEMMSKGKKRQP